MIHWANNKHRQEPWQMQHLVYANKWAVKTLHLNSHSEVLSVLKYLQMDGRTDRKKEKTQNKCRCHIPLECSIFTATQASSSAFLEWKHPALSSRSVRPKKIFFFKKEKQIRHRRIYLSLSLQLRQELLLHACFIIVKRRDEVINDRINFFGRLAGIQTQTRPTFQWSVDLWRFEGVNFYLF